jgi:glutamate carboxypeptidase
MMPPVMTPSDMLQRLRRWSEINSGTDNLAGLARMHAELVEAFAPLGGETKSIDLPPATSIDSGGNIASQSLGQAIQIIKRPDAPLRVLLVIHYDTVYGVDHPFQTTTLLDNDTLRGPGVVDAKGGIMVMLNALLAFEKTPTAQQIGWEVLLNSDEEIGSVGSTALLEEAAKRNHVGLVFEPAFSDGALVSERKGSGTFTAVIRGRAAHVGRDFDKGRSAVLALAELIKRLDAAQNDRSSMVINCGRIEGGGAVNIVPDLAIGRFNVRADTPADQREVEQLIASAARQIGQRDGIEVTLHGRFNSPPRPLDAKSKRLLDEVIAAGREMGLSLPTRPSGGTCDGNKLAAAGLPVVDSLGPVGGELHNDREYIRLSSLTERAQLTAKLLEKLVSHSLPP